MSLYSSSVKRPVTTILIFVAVVILGLFSLKKLPIDLMPDIDTNTIMVMTTYSGASAENIEQNVTRPLENSLNSVEHLKHITSNSRENVSIVTLEFEYGYDIDVLTNDVRDKLSMVSSMLPDDANTPIIFKFSTDMIPIVLLSAQAHESVPGLYKILDEKCISCSLKGNTKQEIIEELSAMLSNSGCVTDGKLLVADMKARDEAMSTGIGKGIAIPHARTDGVSEICVAIGIKKDGIDFGSLDGLPSRIFVMIASPASKSGPQMRVMAALTGALSKDDVRSGILAAETPAQVMEQLKGACR